MLISSLCYMVVAVVLWFCSSDGPYLEHCWTCKKRDWWAHMLFSIALFGKDTHHSHPYFIGQNMSCELKFGEWGCVVISKRGHYKKEHWMWVNDNPPYHLPSESLMEPRFVCAMSPFKLCFHTSSVGESSATKATCFILWNVWLLKRWFYCAEFHIPVSFT